MRILLAAVMLPAVAVAADGLEISGLVLDESKTKAGRDFYDMFRLHWPDPDGIDYTIVISELPDRGLNSQLTCTVDGEVVFRKRLNPRATWIEDEARALVTVVQLHLLRRARIARQIEDDFRY